MAEHLEEERFDRCEAAPQFFANYAQDISVKVHMDDIQGTETQTSVGSGSIQPFTDDWFQGVGRCTTLA